MRIEHFGYQVQDPQAVAGWYCQQFGWTIRRTGPAPANAHFIADGSGQVMIEIYNNPRIGVPDYRSADPLVFHLALTVPDPAAMRDRLVAAGATVAEDLVTTAGGDRLVMLRDPWGLALQLVCRAEAMV